MRFGINVMAIRHPDGGITVAPQGIDVLANKDVLIAIGANSSITKLESLTGK